LVLLPGFDGTGRLFSWFLNELPPELKSVVVSFPTDRDTDYAALELDAERFLPRDRPFVLLGESFSGPLALRIAARGAPNLVAVILVASFVAQPIAWIPGFARDAVHPSLFRLPARSLMIRWFLCGGNPPEALIDSAVESLDSVDPAILAGRAKAALAVDATEALLRCPVPLLYLGGTQDRLIGSDTGPRLKVLRPDLECTMLAAPHFLLQQAPAAAAEAITEFLSRRVSFYRK
jgi:pimeloyl-ACP methyl ester carboxylesterase